MKKHIQKLTAALLLSLNAYAGAQCVAPTPPTVPDFSTWVRKAVDSSTGATTSYGLGDLSPAGAPSSPSTIIYYADYLERAKTFTSTTPTVINMGNVRYLEFGFAWANYGVTGGDPQTINFKYGPAGSLTTYLTMTTPGPSSPTPNTANIVSVNGASLYDASGNPTPSVAVPSKYAVTNVSSAIVDAQLSYNDDVRARRLFYIKLPENAPTSGYLQIEVLGDPNAKFGGSTSLDSGDDFRIWMPAATPTTLCLQKQLDKGTVPNNFTFTTTGLDNLTNADSLALLNQVTIPVAALSMPTSKTNVPSTVSNPGTVTLTENAPGFTITQAICDKHTLLDGTDPNTKVVLSGGTATVTSLPFGSMTTCTFYNTDTTQVNFPKFTLTKNFTGFVNSSDKVNISIAETGGSSASTTVSNTSGSRTGTVVYTGTQLIFGNNDTATQTISQGVPPLFTLGESFVSGTPGNYGKTYSCNNATAGGTAVTTATTALSGSGNGPYSFSIKPAQGDVITCTITNNLTVSPPTTVVNLTKTGNIVTTPGKTVTYNITASNTTATAVDAVLTDTLTPAVTPAANVVPSDGGTYDATTGIVTWPTATVPANGSLTRSVTVTVPASTTPTNSATSYTGPKQMVDNASIATYTSGTSNSVQNNGTTSASVTTSIAFISLDKQVRNVNQNTALGLSAEAKPGDKLEYCINYNNVNGVAVNNMTINDTLASGQSLIVNGEVGGDIKITRTSGGVSNITYASNTNTTSISQLINNVAADETGSFCFQVLVGS